MCNDDKNEEHVIIKPGEVIDPDKLPPGHPFRRIFFGDYLDDPVFDKDGDNPLNLPKDK